MNLKYIRSDLPWSLRFDERVNSADSQKYNTELETIARRHGFEQFINSETLSRRSNTDVFFPNEIINSNGYNSTDFHDDHNHTFCYLCSINQNQHEQTKPRDEYKRRKLIPYNNPKARLLSSSLDRVTQNSSSLDLTSYRFIVRTGTQKNSGTHAQVFLYMYGTEKNWSSIHLQGRMNQNSSSSMDGFPSGSTRTFCLKGPDIGQLHHLNVNLVGSRSNKEWFLKEIEITNLKNSTTWLCEFNCWLPKTDEQEIHEVKLNIDRPTETSFAIYILQIRTGDKPFISTDTNIQILIRGSTNQTSRLVLTSNHVNLFEQNQLDTFAIIGWDLGDLLEIIVESDKNHFVSDWEIKEMTIWQILPNENEKKFHIYFPFNNFLGKKMNTLKSKKELYPLADSHLKGPICYQIIVKTGKVMNAGIDANVFLIIYGTCGRTTIHQLNDRSKNNFERNTSAEFTIMDIDIGKIDRIKIWHDNTNPRSAWFLDSVIIYKKHSTCHTISDIYIQRLEQISKVLYRQHHEQMKKNMTTTHTSSTNENKHHSIDRQSSKLKTNDHLGSNRSILRSPIMNDRSSLQKKVTWDEQSIGSQDDLLSIDSQRTKSMQIRKEQKEESSHHKKDHNDYEIFWISSHNYKESKWQIKSVEETNSFNFDSSIRSLLLSDRLTTKNKTIISVKDIHDEIYEFQANRWLAKDKEDGKLEVYLTPKQSSTIADINIDSRKKPMSSSKLHPTYDDKNKHLSSHDQESIERTPRGLTPRDSQLSSLRSSVTPKTHLNDLHSSQKNVDQFSSHSWSSHENNNLINSLNSEQELLARIAGVPSVRPRPSVTSMSPLSQRSKSPRDINEQESLIRTSRDSENYSSLANISNSSSTSQQRFKSPRAINNFITPITHEQEPLTRVSDSSLNHPRLTTAASSSQNIKSSRTSNDHTNALINTRDSLDRISDGLPNYSRLKPTLTSSLTSNQRMKSLRNSNEFTNSIINEQELLDRITDEPSNRPRSSVNSLSTLNHRTKSPRNLLEQESSLKISDELPSYSQSTSNQRLKSLRNSNEFINPGNSEQELLTRIIGEPSNRSRTSINSLSSINQRTKLPHNTNVPIDSLVNERNTLGKLSNESSNSPRLSSSSTSQFPKSTRLNNDSISSLTKPSSGLSSRPKSAIRSNPHLPSQKSIVDQVYNSAYGTAPSDDF
ncbi:unnamed protein product [Adineta steineri]|uniref:PLAT domain-containing protein n=1 Tax=Adineta steineri TaxID=433720 RepID=A0A814N330_9BILA|nr:unnamed protein product [Adineta steineri]CAF1087210.1 unnamed protein product [Adineta steineri]